MTQEENRDFIIKSESLVKPKDITAISFLGDFNKYLPKKVQQSFLREGTKKVPYMGFIVDPYCFFTSYRIRDRAAAQAMLTDDYELADTSVFRNREKQPLVIVSAFTVRTSAFMGMRIEFYLIARNKKTGQISWIITDYETNTNSHDPKNGFCGYTGDPAVHTVTPYGEILVDVKSPGEGRKFSARADLNAGKMQELDEELWVNGNLSVDYGGALKDGSSHPFSLIFDPALMEKALEIPADKTEIAANTFLNGIIDAKNPVDIAVFPYSQHFIIRQEHQEKKITRKDDLYEEIRAFLDRKDVKSMSGDDLKKPLFRGMLISFLVNLGIIVFLLVILLTR